MSSPLLDFLLRSPVPPLAAAAATLRVAPAPASGWLAAALVIYAAWVLWRWWQELEILVDGMVYKESASASRFPPAPIAPPVGARAQRRERPAEGFCTPLSSEAADEDRRGALPAGAEWAPFGPSLPFGEQPPRPVPVPFWLGCDASVFDVRNIRYRATREKVSSDFALYDCVGSDLIRDRRRIDALVERLPAEAGLPRSLPRAVEWSPAWGVPRVLVVNCQLPYKAGWLMGAHPEDDGGLSVCSYFTLSGRASGLLAAGRATPALGLWRRFVEEGVSTKEGISFKVVGRVEDLEKYEVPESFHRFNNKPVLLTKSSRVISSRLPEVIEIDYDVRGWVYPARTALANYHHRAAEAELEIGYLVEGKSDEELPEQILGCLKLYAMDITQAKWVDIM